MTSPECSLQTWCPPTRDSHWGAFLQNLEASTDHAIRGGGIWEHLKDPHLNPDFQETQEECRELMPRGFPGKEGQGARALKVHALESWWAPTFLELDLKGVRAVGGFGRVLGLCVEAWRRLVLTRQKEVGGWCVRAELCQVSLLQPSPEPGSCWHLWSAGQSSQRAGLPAPLPGASPTCQGPGKQRAREIRQFFPST